jgi:hypothetical protein
MTLVQRLERRDSEKNAGSGLRPVRGIGSA